MFMCVPVLSLHESVRVAKNAMKNASEVSTPKQATIATGTNGMTLDVIPSGYIHMYITEK